MRAAFRNLSPTLRGGIWMMMAALSFTLMTALIRHVAVQIHPFEIAFVRIVTNLVLMLPFAMRVGRALFDTPNHKVYAFRGLIGFTFLMSYFPGAALVPVADAQALIFTAPLFATAMAVLILGERLHVHRLVALIAGFIGMLVILRPGMTEIGIGSVLVLIGALANGSSHVVVKFTTRADTPDMAVFYLALYVTPLIAIPALFVWTTPTLGQLGLMVAIGILATFNQRALSRAFAAADATAVLPFDFARLVFAAAIGFLAFSELPDVFVWAGAGIIFAATVYLTRREVRAMPR